ncbi:class I adenylate-forming enzyme family protein [Rhodococcus qingshengii]|uniref:class I adenylate-forming enzyme family protein n=1 Tax=Rhodococcus qingshengii TaxID=334542 RepID=UPI00237CE347|nr:class I adenylate-forming enzyme family protein [Rhodococcus qingshengii]WCT05773.1 class I adenylate-forming enzyme family protein [Rhodococcus qingshengii]
MNVERVGDLAARAAELWGARECARLDETSISFAELRQWSDAIASDMVANGVGYGDRVMILMVNRLEVIAATVAAWRIGAIATPVVAIYRTHELRSIITDLRPAAVITTAMLGDRHLAADLDFCFAETGITPAVRYVADETAPAGWLSLPTVDSEPVPFAAPPQPTPADDECLRLYTSGSTSAPKGVKLNSNSVIFGGLQFRDRLGIGETDTGLAVAPVAHIAGLLAACIVPLTCGANAVVLPRWDAKAAVQVIDEHTITWSLGAAVFLKDLVEEYERRRDEDIHVLTYYVSGGANTAPELIERADALGMWAARTYGMTEAAGVVTLAPRESSVERRAYWDGKLADNVEARILDDMYEPVSFGDEGRIRIRGQQVLLGYTDESINVEQFDSDGWFDPGDIGSVTEDGWVRITGRTKDIINRGGEKFSTADIENVIHRHDAVDKAAVIGVAHPRLGETVCAFIVPRDDVALTGEDMAQFMIAQDVARAKIPSEWHFVDEIPTTASGKVQKHLLHGARADQLLTVDASAAAGEPT